MVILKLIDIKDFLSHKDTTIPFSEGDKLLFDGVSGSGKSSIIDALLWTLYGVGRVDNRSLIRRGAKQCVVSVVLFDTEKKIFYEVQRLATLAGRNKVTVYEGSDVDSLEEVGSGGTRDTDVYISKNILGASYQLFINSVVFPQDNVESFVTATAGRRKDLLLEILKTADIDEYLAKTKLLIAEKSETAAELKASASAARDLVASYSPMLAETSSLEAKAGEVRISAGMARELVTSEEQDLAKVKAAHEGVFAQETSLAVLKRKAAHLPAPVEHTQKEVNEALEKIKEEEQTRKLLGAAIEHNNKMSAAVSDRPHLRDYASEIEAIDRRIKALKDNTLPCPAGDDCPYTKIVGPELQTLLHERGQKEVDASKQQAAFQEWEERLKAFGSRRDISYLEADLKAVDAARTVVNDVAFAVAHKEMVSEMARLEKILKDAPTIEDVRRCEQEVVYARGKMKEADDELAKLTGRLEYLNTIRQESDRLSADIIKFGNEEADVHEEIFLLKELREAFGPSGVTAVALDYLLPSLEDKINDILGMLSDFRVILSTQRDSATGTKVEGLFITVRNEKAEEFDFNSYSGGERVRISVAISEALASLQKCGFRIMDEAVSALDENMIDDFTRVLAKIQGRYSQTINISHIQQVKDMFDKRVSIVKLDGISKVIVSSVDD